MRTREEILKNLEDIFLKVQNKIRQLKPGSIIRSIFYSVASEAENIFEEIDEIKRNSYIHTASGEYLDNLIYGFSRLERRRGTNAIGYVTLRPIDIELNNEDIINSLSLRFAKYDYKNKVLLFGDSASFFEVSTINGTNKYVLLPPFSLSISYFDDSYYEVINGKQQISEIFKQRLIFEFNKNFRKKIAYIVLPVVSYDFGADKNLQTNSLNEVLNAKNTFFVENNYDYSIDSTTQTVIDIDGVCSLQGNMFILGEFSFISGGQDEEDDESYRNRFYSYLSSLTSSSKEALENKIKEIFTDATVKITPLSVPGFVDVYVDTLYLQNPIFSYLISQSLEDVKPVGTVLNVKIPKIVYANILLDLKNARDLEQDIISLRQKLNNLVSSLNTSEHLAYGPVLSTSYETNNTVTNVFIGYSLDSFTFNKYSRYYKTFICNNYSGQNLPDFCSNNNLPSFENYLEILNNGEINLFVYNPFSGYKSFVSRTEIQNNNFHTFQAPQYPLKEIVSAIKKNIFSLPDQDLNNAIKAHCSNITDELCLRYISTRGLLPNTKIFNISLQDIEAFSKIYANYYKIKLFTVPPASSNDIELCLGNTNNYDFCSINEYDYKLVFYLHNDIVYFPYTELDSVKAESFEKIRLGSSSILNKDMLLKYNVGVRLI